MLDVDTCIYMRRDMLEGGFVSHVGRDGRKPYQRYCAPARGAHVAEVVFTVEAASEVSTRGAQVMYSEASLYHRSQ
jgi:hypothetical protein